MRISHIRINKQKFINNLTKLKNQTPGSDLIAIIKANAYGHGIKPIANILRMNKVEYLGVAYPSEAAILRDSGDLGKIIVIVPPALDDGKFLVDLDLEFVIDNLERLRRFNTLAEEKNVVLNAHLFINTGMNRDGIPPNEVLNFFQQTKEFSNVNLKGVCTQFADSENPDSSLAKMQINKFNLSLRELKRAGFNPEMKHICNTGGTINFPNSSFTHTRCGIGLYGYADEKPLADKLNLEPVLSIKSEILTIRQLGKGENVGYSKLFVSDKPMKIAVIPIGYGDGYSKLFTNKGSVIHKGKKLPIVGSVCMDQFMIDVSEAEQPKVGDEVILLSDDSNSELLAYDLADMLGTIPYEILTNLNDRLPRKYI